jgi:hypothetical protein
MEKVKSMFEDWGHLGNNDVRCQERDDVRSDGGTCAVAQVHSHRIQVSIINVDETVLEDHIFTDL